MAEENQSPQTPQDAQQDAGAPQPTGSPQAGAAQPEAAGTEQNRDARMWAMFAHLAGLAGLVPILPAFGCIIGPLVVWLVKKEEFPFVDEQGKEAVNFQISMLIYTVVCAMTCVGLILVPIIAIVDIVLLIVAAIKANDGWHYRYPLTIRFIK